MKKIIFSISIIFLLLICNGSTFYYGLEYSTVAQVKQQFDSWCFYAVCEMQYGFPQCYAATRYQEWIKNNNQEAWPATDCCSAEGIFCSPVYFKDLIPFYNEYGGENFSRWNSLHNFIRYGTPQNEGDRVLPRLGILDQGEFFHAVWLFKVVIEITHSMGIYTYQEVFV